MSKRRSWSSVKRGYRRWLLPCIAHVCNEACARGWYLRRVRWCPTRSVYLHFRREAVSVTVRLSDHPPAQPRRSVVFLSVEFGSADLTIRELGPLFEWGTLDWRGAWHREVRRIAN